MRGRTRTRMTLFDMRKEAEKRATMEDVRLLSDDEEDYIPHISVIDGWEYEESIPRRQQRRPWKAGAAIVLVALIIFIYALIQDMKENHWMEKGFNPSLRETDGALAIHLHPDDHSYREPRSLTFNWTITTGVRAPDGVEKEVYLINGESPGPVVEARSGDSLTFNVINQLQDPHGLSMHWHGIFMQDANDMDGALGLTQPAIPKGGSKTYEFTIASDQCGTFWYHADSHLQRADGLYGGLIIHCPESRHESVSGRHDSDQLLMISDWYHVSSRDVLNWYNSAKSFGNNPVPDSLIINHGGAFDCSKVKPALPVVCSQLEAPKLMHLPKGSTRLRIVNSGSLAGFTIHANNVTLTPFALDGDNMIESARTTSIGVLYPGERVDVLIDPMESSSSASIQIIMNTENLRFGNPALTTNQRFPISVSQSPMIAGGEPNLSRNVAPGSEFFDLQQASALTKVNFSAAADTILLYANTLMLPHMEKHPVGSFNQSSWVPSPDWTGPALIDTPFEHWPDHLLAPTIKAEQWVDVVINNMDEDGHAFHLHGHSFYVMRTHKANMGYGNFNPYGPQESTPPSEPTVHTSPRMKDTVYVPAKGHVVIRFKPHKGLWAFQSSMVWHRAIGMGMAFEVI